MKKYFIRFAVCFLLVATSIFFGGCTYGYGIFPKNLNNTGTGEVHESNQIDVSKIASYENLISTCKPAVVGIAAINGRYQSIGTGVCINSGSYVLTNNHVVENGNVINLYLSDGSTTNASIVWTDVSSDLAMLKAGKSIPYLPLAVSGSYNSGDEVVAIGTPLDLAFKHSATKGIISAVNRTISVDNNYGESTLYNLIQHDASINPGNSGGPLINMKGEIVGINTVKVTDAEGMGFAIPVDTFKPVIEKISANGSYDTTYIGVFGYDNQLKHVGKKADGFYVQSVSNGSVAEKSGIKTGDVIVSVNNKSIHFAKDLKIALYEHNVGDNVEIAFKRDGELKTVNLTLEKHPYSYMVGKLIQIEEK